MKLEADCTAAASPEKVELFESGCGLSHAFVKFLRDIGFRVEETSEVFGFLSFGHWGAISKVKFDSFVGGEGFAFSCGGMTSRLWLTRFQWMQAFGS